MIDALTQDTRYVLRGLRKKPGFTVAVVATLALGLGANATMFGIVDRMLFRPPPMMADPSSTHRIYTGLVSRGKERIRSGGDYARYVDLTTKTSSFSRTAAFTEEDLAVGTGDAAREMRVAVVTASFFEFFNAAPALGRYFTAAEDEPPAGTPVAVLSHTAWRTQFGERSDALGAKVRIGSVTYAIVGVAPAGFVGLWPNQSPAFFIPVTTRGAALASTMTLQSSWWKSYQLGWLAMIAQRKPGVSVETASADLTRAMQQSYEQQLAENPRDAPAKVARPRAFASSILTERGPNESSFAKVATWVAGVAIIVLLVACANVANLLLARAIRRRREVAVRLALGISRGRLLSQLLIESVILALLGGGAGILVAQSGGAAVRTALMPGSAAPGAMHDGRTIAFASAVALAVGLLTGLAPALAARRVDLTHDLKTGLRDGTHQRSRMRVALLLLQAALSVVLLVGAGLFVRSLSNVQSMRLGYDAEPVSLVELNMAGQRLDRASMIELRQRLLERAKAIPGVERASLQISAPFWGWRSTGLFVDGIDTVSKLGRFDLNAVSPDHFATLGTRIVRGRGFTDADAARAPRVMIVSESMARTLWPGKDAIGQCVHVSADTMPCTHVVGVAENIRETSMSDDPGLYYYLPAAQFSPETGGLFVRTRGVSTRFVELLRRELQREMPGVSYVTVTPFADIVGRQTQSWKLGATMFVVFGALALVLAVIGLYSVVAYDVAQRTHEVGVRLALGAQSLDVVRLIVGDGLRLGAAGVALGTVVSLAAARWVKPLLFDESPRDPVVFAVVTATLLAATLAASWIPAMRAARVDPNVALRNE